MKQNRFRSPVLWAAVAAFIAFVLKTYLKIELEGYDTLVSMVLGLLVMFGIINSPDNKDSL